MSARARQLAVLLLLPAVLALGQWWVVRPAFPAGGDTQRVSVASAVELDPLWIDARSGGKYEKEHIPGALPLTLQDWEAQLPAIIEAWTPERPIVVYCGGAGCDDSAAVAARLKQDLASENVWVLESGIDAWRADGRELIGGGGE